MGGAAGVTWTDDCRLWLNSGRDGAPLGLGRNSAAGQKKNGRRREKGFWPPGGHLVASKGPIGRGGKVIYTRDWGG